MSEINRKRWLELIYTMALGDALLTLLFPGPHMRLWRNAMSFSWWRRLADWCEEHPTATRLFGLAEGLFALRGFQRIFRDL